VNLAMDLAHMNASQTIHIAKLGALLLVVFELRPHERDERELARADRPLPLWRLFPPAAPRLAQIAGEYWRESLRVRLSYAGLGPCASACDGSRKDEASEVHTARAKCMCERERGGSKRVMQMPSHEEGSASAGTIAWSYARFWMLLALIWHKS